MKIALIQMDMALGKPAENFARAERLIRRAAENGPDVICLPEMWNTGFFPREDLARLADPEGRTIRERTGTLARELHTNLIAGSAAVRRRQENRVTNTAMIFDREGEEIAEYDKVHLFSHMEEEKYFQAGDQPCVFELDGVRCGMVICYDLRFPEWVRKPALAGAKVLFAAAQWPAERIPQWLLFTRARAAENQLFVAAANSCGRAGTVRYGGHSVLVDPLGNVLAEAGESEEILEAEMDLSMIAAAREEIRIYRDRREELY